MGSSHHIEFHKPEWKDYGRWVKDAFALTKRAITEGAGIPFCFFTGLLGCFVVLAFLFDFTQFVYLFSLPLWLTCVGLAAGLLSLAEGDVEQVWEQQKQATLRAFRLWDVEFGISKIAMIGVALFPFFYYTLGGADEIAADEATVKAMGGIGLISWMLSTVFLIQMLRPGRVIDLHIIETAMLHHPLLGPEAPEIEKITFRLRFLVFALRHLVLPFFLFALLSSLLLLCIGLVAHAFNAVAVGEIVAMLYCSLMWLWWHAFCVIAYRFVLENKSGLSPLKETAPAVVVAGEWA